VISRTVSVSSTGGIRKRAISREPQCSINHTQGLSPKFLSCTRVGGHRQHNVSWTLRQRRVSGHGAHLHNR
jgi:hypothetical protein